VVSPRFHDSLVRICSTPSYDILFDGGGTRILFECLSLAPAGHLVPPAKPRPFRAIISGYSGPRLWRDAGFVALRIAVISPFLDRRHGTERVILEQVQRFSERPDLEIHIYAQQLAT